MKKVLTVILALFLAISLIATASCSAIKTETNSFGVADESKRYENDSSYNLAQSENGSIDYEYQTDGISKNTDIDKPEINMLHDGRKLIVTVSATIETLEYPETVILIKSRCSEYNGYIQESEERGGNEQKSDSQRYAYFTLRIPAEKLESFMAGMNDLGNVVALNRTTDDVTDSYFDKEARISTLKIQEERYLALLEKAASLDAIIQLEKALSEVRYEIESLTGTLKKYDSMVEYSTLVLTVREVYNYSEEEQKPPVNFGEKLINQLSGSWKAFLTFCEFLMLAFVTLLPFLPIPAIAVVITVICVRRSKKNKK